MKRNILIYTVIIGSIALLAWNISELNFENIQKGPFTGILSNILCILAMFLLLVKSKKGKKLAS